MKDPHCGRMCFKSAKTLFTTENVLGLYPMHRGLISSLEYTVLACYSIIWPDIIRSDRLFTAGKDDG